MSTFWTWLFVAVMVYLFGALAWFKYKQRRAFKRGWAELERMLDDGEI